MSLALIQESAKEVRRLAVAGSPLAVGDFRLKKLIAPLEQASAKVPVFAQVAKAINDVVNGKESDSAANLLNLSTLLNAILYTQGQSGAEGAICELETFASNSASTRAPARLLKPLVQALTSTGSGRFEIVKSSFERGAFNDLRLIDPALRALDDSYPELVEFLVEKIIPTFGPGVVPKLKAAFNPKGKRADLWRIQLMHELDPDGTIDLCREALESGSPEVKVGAILSMGEQEQWLPLIMEHANAKAKVVRVAALTVLAKHDRPEIAKLFTGLIKGKELDILVGPFQGIRNQQVLKSLLDEGQRVFDLMLKGDAEQMVRFVEILNCLEKRAEAEAFLLGCFAHSEKLAKLKAAKNSQFIGADLLHPLTMLLYRLASPLALDAILAKRDTLPAECFDIVLRSALRRWKPEKVYDEFSSLLGCRNGAGEIKSSELQRCLLVAHGHQSSHLESLGGVHELDTDGVGALNKSMWDARWLDAAIKADQRAVVCGLARPGHKAALNYILKLPAPTKSPDAGQIFRALARCQYPKVTDYFLDLVAKKTKGGKYSGYELHYLFENARHLPAADLPRLDAFAAQLDEKFLDHFLEAIAPLRPTHQPAQA